MHEGAIERRDRMCCNIIGFTLRHLCHSQWHSRFHCTRHGIIPTTLRQSHWWGLEVKVTDKKLFQFFSSLILTTTLNHFIRKKGVEVFNLSSFFFNLLFFKPVAMKQFYFFACVKFPLRKLSV